MQSLYKILIAIPIIILTTIFNVFICFSVASVVIIQLLSIEFNSKGTLAIGIAIAIAVQLYIISNHKLYSYIKKLSKEQGAATNE